MKSTYADEYGVKLYSQGFFRFGPMEQCGSGEWVRWADVEPFLRAAELRVQTAMETEEETLQSLSYSRASTAVMKDKYLDTSKLLKVANRKAAAYLCVAFGLLISFVVLYLSGRV